MDPLSITAGIVAVVGASTHTVKLLKKLTSNKVISLLARALEEELSDLRLAALTIQDLIITRRANQVSGQDARVLSDMAPSIASSLEKARRVIDDFDSILKPTLGLVLNSDTSGLRKWYILLKKEKKLGQLRRELQDVRLRLNTIIGLLCLYVTIPSSQSLITLMGKKMSRQDPS